VVKPSAAEKSTVSEVGGWVLVDVTHSNLNLTSFIDFCSATLAGSVFCPPCWPNAETVIDAIRHDKPMNAKIQDFMSHHIKNCGFGLDVLARKPISNLGQSIQKLVGLNCSFQEL
jgi:hypothetical protein